MSARVSKNADDYANDLARRLDEQERLNGPHVDEETIRNELDEVYEKRGEIKLRYAMLTVFDDGDPETGGLPWAVDHVFPDTANDSRIRFCDAVVEQLRRG